MNSMEFSLGIDLAQESFEVAIAPEGTHPATWRTLAHTALAAAPDSDQGIQALLKWTNEQCPEGKCLRVVVESTGQLSKRFACALRGQGLPEVVILNPRRSKAFGVSLGVQDKTDRIDAAILALYAMVHRCEPTEPDSAVEARLRELTRLRQSYLDDVTAWENRLLEISQTGSRKFIEKTIKELKKQVKELDKAIENEVLSDEKMAFQVKCLKKIKGIKQVGATTLTAELGDLTKYRREKIVGRTGMFAKKFESGSSVHKPARLAKGGCRCVRRVIYMCATSILRSKGPLRQYAERLRERGFEEMDILMAVMRKLLLIARAVMKNGGNYDESKITCGGEV